MNFKEKLTEQLLSAGASAVQFSIDDPKDNRLNLIQTPEGYEVWYQTPGGAKYSDQQFATAGEAVYDLVTRMLPTQIAEKLAYEYGDPKLVIYHPEAIEDLKKH